MTLIASLISIIFALIAGVSFLLGKKNTAETLLKNNDVKNQVSNLNGQVTQNNAAMASEEAKRTEIETNLKKEENKDVSKEDLTKFLNDPNGSNGKS